MVRREQPHEGVAGDHAARDAGGRCQRRSEEAGTAALLEHALLIVRRVLRRWRRRLLIIGLLRLPAGIAGLATAAPAGITLRRCALLPVAAAEQTAEEAAAGAPAGLLHLLGTLAGLLQLPLQPLDAVLCLRQGVFL